MKENHPFKSKEAHIGMKPPQINSISSLVTRLQKNKQIAEYIFIINFVIIYLDWIIWRSCDIKK